jgi:hypothetical protein
MRGAFLPTLGLLLAGLLLAPAPSRADEDLPAKRNACQIEARHRIKPRGRAMDRAMYQAIVDRRQNFIRACMAKAPAVAKSSPAASARPQAARRTHAAPRTRTQAAPRTRAP